MNTDRQHEALRVRVIAAELAARRAHPRHVANGDEQRFRRVNDEGDNVPSYLASFTKGLPHDPKTGLVADPSGFQRLVKGIDSGDPRDFQVTPLGPIGALADGSGPWKSVKAQTAKALVRAWESQGAGLTFDLEGPDAQAVTMPPAPALGSDELTAEIAEVYAQALLRDVPFTTIEGGSGVVSFNCDGEQDTTVEYVLEQLNKLNWFKDSDCCSLTPAEASRKRKSGALTGQTAFRGITPGDDIGPYISQFLLAGTGGINGNDNERMAADGHVTYGALSVDQRVRFAQPCEDHMTQWYEWLDVQNGADLRDMDSYVDDPRRRFITTPRDLATYVHYDALYEAYLNACLILLAMKVPFDPDIPFQGPDFVDHQQGFAHFGGPHILSLVTEVATRALKAVRYQKFNVHRRLRPEALAARLARREEINEPVLKDMADTDGLAQILGWIAEKNGPDPKLVNGNYLLPMAFCEGSPMHPSYGAGHATVAGACATILKAFFDHKHPLTIAGDAKTAFVPEDDGLTLTTVPVVGGTLTVEGELNKLASNISIGRDWAGVHYFSDYIESLRMGEQIAIGMLEEQKLTYGENVSMTVPLFDGGSIRI
jgi:hypothetical protein